MSSPGWPRLLIARPTPRGDEPWGVLAPLVGTPWEGLIQVVTGEALSHALHGWFKPLMDQLGPPPTLRLKRVPNEAKVCANARSCAIADARCMPNPKVPLCFEVPGDDHVAELATALILLWREGYHVIVAIGREIP